MRPKLPEVVIRRRSASGQFASDDISVACFDGNHDCVMVGCKCPCHESLMQKKGETLKVPLSAFKKRQ